MEVTIKQVKWMAQGLDYDFDLAESLTSGTAQGDLAGVAFNIVFDEREDAVEGDRVVIADVVCVDGAQRVALYRSNAMTGIDCLNADETEVDFAEGWYSNNGNETPEILKQLIAKS